ncbi:ABC transporter permease [Nautilia sp. PV-1]|uniref:ABC transporter permease n=1 Tax=Nautilia sp. PV-1 TaxID=2579250 RepID=UPI000FD9F95D|nr:ABC transporter permease [Nautilia sp. PV-1]AZV47307.1 ABC transporter permease [Nautilia sp. PV-1]
MKGFWAVFKKEILLFLRNIGLVFFVLYMFTFDIYTAGKGIEIKPQNVSIGYVNRSGSVIPEKIISHFHQPEFQKPKMFLNEKDLKRAIFNRRIMVGIIFDKNFEKDFVSHKTAQINVLIDATASAQAQVTLIYLNQILYAMLNTKMPLNVKIHKLFNQNSNSEWFMSLSELMSVITMLALILIAVVFVKEKEAGTWDIMLLMPVSGNVIILAKVLSQIALLMVGIVISVGIVVFGIFDVPINGNLLAFFVLSFFFALSLGGIALVIAAYSNSVMQVSQVSMLVMLPLLFLSGAWTPINSMNQFLQTLTIFSPVRYFIEGTESIFFRGTDFINLLPYFAGEIIIGVVLFYIGFKKMGRLF